MAFTKVAVLGLGKVGHLAAELLAEAGFEAAGVEPTRVYSADDARAIVGDLDPSAAAQAGALEGAVMSAFVRATKPRS